MNKIQVNDRLTAVHILNLTIIMVSQRRLTYHDLIKITVLEKKGYSMETIAARVRRSYSYNAVSKTLSRFKETCRVDDETTFW